MKCFSVFLFCAMCALWSCQPGSQEPENNYQVEVVSSAEGDVPTGAPVEVVLGFKQFATKVQQLSFDFPASQVAVTVDGATAVPGQRVSVVLEGTALAKFKVTGLKAGTHQITVRAENGSATASCVVSLSVSDRVYRVDLLNNPIPVLTIGKKEDIYLKVVDMQDPNHLFYTTPGYKVAARSLHDTLASIIVGVTEVWNNTASSPIVDLVPLNWVANEGTMLYNGLSIGTHQVEFTVTAPDGATSRTVHTFQVDSSKVVLTPRQTPKTTLSVTERHEATFDVDYLGHPANKVALMWEELPAGDPYGAAPDVTIDFVRPKAGEWGEFKYAREIGATTYPLPPAKAGSKQGFVLHVKDMYGWQQSFEYRFDVNASGFSVSLVKSNTPYVQNMLNWVKLRIEDYPANSTFRYKLVPAESGYESVVFNEKQYDTWYEVNLAGGKGEPYETSMFFAYGKYSWAYGSFRVVVEDKYEVQSTVAFVQMFEPNEIAVTASQDYLTATVGTPITWNCTTNILKTDQHSYNNATWKSPGLDPQAGVLKVNNVTFQAPEAGLIPQAFVSGDNRVVQMNYTPTTAGVHEISLVPVTWCNDGSATKVVRINVIPSGGSFAITPDRTTYEIPYSEAQVYQDITVTLASGNETAGLYDWNDTYKIGTSVYYSSNGSMGRLVALDALGNEVAIAAKTTVPLKYAVGKTLRLRHYPAQVNNGSIERIALTATRKDGTTATATVTVEVKNAGSFAITPDQTTYEIPYSEARVYQDIAVTLASGNESAGLYDWNDTYKIGTSVYYSSNGSMGRLVALDAAGREVAIGSQTTVPLKYAVGKTLRLRHYPAQVNDGSIERIVLTVTRKDGTTATATVTVDAEDHGFELVEDQAGWTNPPPKVGAKFGVPFRVVNRSKYYRGTYQLKSYKIQDNKAVIVPSDEVPPTQNIPLNGERGIELHLIASSAGMTTLKELIIQDDFGRGVTYTNTGFSFNVAVK